MFAAASTIPLSLPCLIAWSISIFAALTSSFWAPTMVERLQAAHFLANLAAEVGVGATPCIGLSRAPLHFSTKLPARCIVADTGL